MGDRDAEQLHKYRIQYVAYRAYWAHIALLGYAENTKRNEKSEAKRATSEWTKLCLEHATKLSLRKLTRSLHADCGVKETRVLQKRRLYRRRFCGSKCSFCNIFRGLHNWLAESIEFRMPLHNFSKFRLIFTDITLDICANFQSIRLLAGAIFTELWQIFAGC